MSQFDQTSTRITATGAVTTGRARLHSVYYVGAASAGRITLTDGNGGTTRFDIDIPAGSGAVPMALYLGEESGIVFKDSIYCSTIGTTAVTLFYTT